MANRSVLRVAKSVLKAKCGVISVNRITAVSTPAKPIKSHLAIRSTEDLQSSRVAAYSYLIP